MARPRLASVAEAEFTDAQICDGRIEKWIAAGDEQPHVLNTVTPVGTET